MVFHKRLYFFSIFPFNPVDILDGIRDFPEYPGRIIFQVFHLMNFFYLLFSQDEYLSSYFRFIIGVQKPKRRFHEFADT